MPTFEVTVEQVGSLLRARTLDGNGVERGTFLPKTGQEADLNNTRPTAEQVEHIIARATNRVVARIGTREPCTADLAESAAGVVALQAALMVELTYFPEQVQSNRSPYEQMKDMFTEELRDLAEAIHETCGTGIGDEGTDNQGPAFDYGPYVPIGRQAEF